MDKYKLRISNFSNSEIQNIIEKNNKIDRLEVEFHEANISNPKSYDCSDVLVIDANFSADMIDTLNANKANYSVVVLSCDDEYFVKLTKEQQDSFFDVWITNSRTVYEYRINHFLYRMRDYFDAELASKQLDTLIDSVPDLIWFKDVIGAHIKVNDSFCKTVNKTKEQIKYRGHCYIWDLDIEEYEQGEFVCMETEEVVIAEQGTFLFDEKVKIGEEMRQLKTYKSAIVGRNGETIGTVGLARDVTDVWNTHAEFKTLINHLPFPMMIVTDDLKFVSANGNFDDIFGIEDDITSFNLEKFGINFFGKSISMPNITEGVISAEIVKNGKVSSFMIEKSAIYDVFNQLNGFFFIFNDVTTQKEYERKLKLISQTDELTELNNRIAIRNYFDSNYLSVCEEQIPFAVMMIDIDYFKNYNDLYGHIKGDNILKEFGNLLIEISKEFDVFVARYGGEEFILVAKGKTAKECEEIAQTLCERVRDLNIIHESSVIANFVTLSIGICYNEKVAQGKTVGDLIKCADTSLYTAKNNGRNQWVITQN